MPELDLEESFVATPEQVDLGSYFVAPALGRMTIVDGGDGISTTVWGDDGEYHPG